MRSRHAVPAAVLVLALLPCASLAAAAEEPAIAKKCRADLAERLKLDLAEVTVADIQPVTWNDGSLGLPQPGYGYTLAVESGWSLLLEAKNKRYLYTASEKAFRYAGPVALWQYSALYTEPIENEPNLNGRVMQVSLCGTNPVVVIEGVTDVQPQPNGSLVGIRRTSRSGHDLLYLPPGRQGEPIRLASGFAFADVAVRADGAAWIAFMRAEAGGGWRITAGPTRENAAAGATDLPEGAAASRLFWDNELPVAEVKVGERRAYYRLRDPEGQPAWEKLNDYRPAEDYEFVLNKSQSLDIIAEEADGKPVTRIVVAWFNGDEDPVAVLPGFRHRQASLTPELPFLLLSGEREGTPVSLVVDISSGEVIPCLEDIASVPVLFRSGPPAGRALLSRHAAALEQ